MSRPKGEKSRGLWKELQAEPRGRGSVVVGGSEGAACSAMCNLPCFEALSSRSPLKSGIQFHAFLKGIGTELPSQLERGCCEEAAV